MPCLPAHVMDAVVCAGGPSLKRSLPEIRKRARNGGAIFTINKTSQYLFDNGIVGKAAVVLLDPQPLLAGQFAADKRAAYFVASQCPPEVFDKLADHPEVLIWHAQDSGPELEIIRRHYPDPVIIGNGTTAALRTIGLAHALGFRTLHYYGLDGSFEPDEKGWLQHHAYAQAEDDAPEVMEIVARDGGEERRFLTRYDYARQADEFMDRLLVYRALFPPGHPGHLRVYVHGDGLIPHIWRKRRHELA